MYEFPNIVLKEFVKRKCQLYNRLCIRLHVFSCCRVIFDIFEQDMFLNEVTKWSETVSEQQ